MDIASVKSNRAKINWEFFTAYGGSHDYKNELINLDGAIRCPEEIVKACREFGITELTISSGYADMINTLAEFEKCGCNISGFAELNDDKGRFAQKIRAIKMKIV